MKPFKVLTLLLPVVLWANPIMTGVVNEFITDTTLGQKIELYTPWASGNIPLIGTRVITSGGTAYVDTNIIWPSGGFATIDRSVLSGPFYMALTSGSFDLYLEDYFDDGVVYPDTPSIPAPRAGCSVARYSFDSYTTPGIPKFDYYVDASPTIGSDNNDYPGCRVSGHVYRNGSPAEGARLVADCYDSILNPYPYATICTTYSQSDGSYHFDSLVPTPFWIEAFFAPYNSIARLTPVLHASRPVINFDFSFIGTEEGGDLATKEFSIAPNPFRHETRIRQGSGGQERAIRIYGLTGQLVKTINARHDVVWRGDDDCGRPLPAGVYFCRHGTVAGPAIIKIVKLQ